MIRTTCQRIEAELPGELRSAMNTIAASVIETLTGEVEAELSGSPPHIVRDGVTAAMSVLAVRLEELVTKRERGVA